MPRTPRPTPYATDPANAELRRIRGGLQLTKVAFARLLGCSFGNLWNIETGHQRVPVTLLRLARYLARDANLVSVPAPVPPPDPTSVGMVLTPATTCDWREPRCRGPWWHMRATVTRLTHVECTVCDYHLPVVYRLLVQRLRTLRLPKDVPPPPSWPPAVRAQQEETPPAVHAARAYNERHNKARDAFPKVSYPRKPVPDPVPANRLAQAGAQNQTRAQTREEARVAPDRNGVAGKQLDFW